MFSPLSVAAFSSSKETVSERVSERSRPSQPLQAVLCVTRLPYRCLVQLNDATIRAFGAMQTVTKTDSESAAGSDFLRNTTGQTLAM